MAGSSSITLSVPAIDEFFHATVAGQNIYATGLLRTAASAKRWGVAKVDRFSLAVSYAVADDASDTGGAPEGRSVLRGGNFLWEMYDCYPDPPSPAGTYIGLVKLNEADGSLNLERAFTAGGGVTYIRPKIALQDAENIYICGSGEAGSSIYGIITKINKTSFVLSAHLISLATTAIRGMCQDGTHLYLVGYGNDANRPTFILKVLKSDMTLTAKANYGNTSGGVQTQFFGVDVQGNYVYAVGVTTQEGAGGSDAIIVRYNKSDLSIAARKILGDANPNIFNSVWLDPEDGTPYAVGTTGAAPTAILITKWAADLSSVTQIQYASDAAGADRGNHITGDIYGLVITGIADSDAIIISQDKALTTGASTPASFTSSALTLTLADSALTVGTPSWTLSTFTLSVSSHTPSVEAAGSTVFGPYVIGSTPEQVMQYTIDPLTRVSGIRWMFDASRGKVPDYYMEILLGGVSTDYVSAMRNAKPTPAITPVIANAVNQIEARGRAGFQQADYESYLRRTDIDIILRTFGKFPSYGEWLDRRIAVLR